MFILIIFTTLFFPTRNPYLSCRYGFYLTSNSPPLRFMSMPNARSNQHVVKVLNPEAIPDWEERRKLWLQLRQVYVQVPGLRGGASMGLKKNREVVDDISRADVVWQHPRVTSRACSTALGGGDREGTAAISSGQNRHDLLERKEYAVAAELETELGLGAHAFVLGGSLNGSADGGAGSIGGGRRVTEDIAANMSPNCGLADMTVGELLQSIPDYSNPSSLNVSLGMSGNDSLNRDGATAPSQAGLVPWMTVRPSGEISGTPLLTLPVLIGVSRQLRNQEEVAGAHALDEGAGVSSQQQNATADSHPRATPTGRYNDSRCFHQNMVPYLCVCLY